MTATTITIATTTKNPRGAGRKPIIFNNTYTAKAIRIIKTSGANHILCRIDDVITGACNLDLRGNTRPIRKNTLLTILTRLDFITSESVAELLQVSPAHARDLAALARVSSVAIRNTLDKCEWVIPEDDEFDYLAPMDRFDRELH